MEDINEINEIVKNLMSINNPQPVKK